MKSGRNCLIVAQAGVSGSTVLENNVVGGQSGVAGHLHIGEGASVAGAEWVSKSLNTGNKVRGTCLPISNISKDHCFAKTLARILQKVENFGANLRPKDKS